MNKTVKREGLVIFYFIIAWRLFLLIEIVFFGIRAEDGSYAILFTFIGYLGYLLSRFAIWRLIGNVPESAGLVSGVSKSYRFYNIDKNLSKKARSCKELSKNYVIRC